jgi:predicted transcriptional regulator
MVPGQKPRCTVGWLTPVTGKHPTIHENYLISLIDGKRYTLLKHHIHAHGYTPEGYREAFGLPDDYPMTPAS